MYQLSISAACSYVRRAMDELTSVEEIGMIVSPDAVDIHRLIEGNIVEAAVKVHTQAPAIMIDGVKGVHGKENDFVAEVSKDGVITITMQKDTVRIASVKAVDSDVVVSDLIPEDSAEGRKQLNKFVRGVPDDPRVVLQKIWMDDYKPVLKYYTCLDPFKTETVDITENIPPSSDLEENIPSIDINYSPVEVTFVPYPWIEDGIVKICPRLEYAVLNELTAMVLESLSMADKAALCREKAVNYMTR